MSSSSIAFIDESIRAADGTYVLAASMVEEGLVDDVNAGLRAIARGKRIHWHGVSAKARSRLLVDINQLPFSGIVMIGEGLDPRRQERARAKLMAALLPRLADMGITTIHLERRTDSLNRRDERTVAWLRGSRRLPPETRVHLTSPSAEPGLWLADILAGASATPLDGAIAVSMVREVFQV